MPISGAFANGDELDFEDAVIEIDLTPSAPSWAAAESWLGSVAVTGGEAPSSNYKTFTARIVRTAEQNTYVLTFECVYTEALASLFRNMWDTYKANPGAPVDARYSNSGTIGELRFTTNGGKLTNCTPPQPNANDSSVLVSQFVIEAGDLTSAAIV